MSAAKVAEAPADGVDQQERKAAPEKRARSKPRRQPPYAVVLHNDPLNTMDHVVGVLQKVFHYGRFKATWLMLKAHSTGRCVVWSGTLEVAELKADQIRSAGPDPVMKLHGATALSVSIEPLPS